MVFRSFLHMKVSMNSSSNLHNIMFFKLLQAHMSFFHNNTSDTFYYIIFQAQAERGLEWQNGGGHSTLQEQREPRGHEVARKDPAASRTSRARICDTGMTRFPRLAEPWSHVQIRHDKAPWRGYEPCVPPGSAPGICAVAI
ncbi:hypothetical protein G5I_01470 [Acromyrmex echinatior]|uniref:Uncharacterized protein n=1 Tax=Acromyrmex echinatior TaxID=103372 RepID=F4W7R6_ACREC|nr:hypothetical protein G5I_01470 [Acromyrmex echinatior]